jgi:6-phosphogluconate dehydrogenase
MNKEAYDIGMIGLGVMGRNLVLNMADHGNSVAGYDKDESKVTMLEKDAGDRKIYSAKELKEFIKVLKKPRAVMLLVPAGKIVDSVISELLPHLDKGDLIIDAGNSDFKDTNRRVKELEKKKILFMGMGVSGGEKGARYGPSMMPGGSKEGYDRVGEILEQASAKVDGDPCVTYLGPRSAGHYVKMVHNGIEYAIMQLISETYDLMKRGLGLNDDELHEVYKDWNNSEMSSFLVEITADIFEKGDDKTGKRLVDVILDAAKQKGTGKWTSQDAMDLQVPVPTIDAAVSVRDLSGFKDERENAEKVLSGPDMKISEDRDKFISTLKKAFYFAMILAYSQGMELLRVATGKYEYGLNLKDVARIWRGGCIIRANFLENIRSAFEKDPNLTNLIIDPDISKILMNNQDDVRKVVCAGATVGIPVPGFASAISYYDGYRSAWLPANLIQAQRDYFGAHTYERIDEEGVFHTQWSQE